MSPANSEMSERKNNGTCEGKKARAKGIAPTDVRALPPTVAQRLVKQKFQLLLNYLNWLHVQKQALGINKPDSLDGLVSQCCYMSLAISDDVIT